MIYKKLKNNVNANVFVDFPEQEISQDLIRIERKADINTQEIAKTNTNVANNTQEINALKTQVQNNENSIEQLDQELNSFAKLGLDNTFTANNTFNNPIVVGEPINDNNAVTKSYVDSKITNLENTKITKGDAIDMGGQLIYNVGNPNNASDVATKGYVDSLSKLKKLVINVDSMGIREQFTNGGMRFIVRNYDLWTNHQIGYTQIVGVTYCNKNGNSHIITGYCVFVNSWIEVQFLNAYSGNDFSQAGEIYVWYL